MKKYIFGGAGVLIVILVVIFAAQRSQADLQPYYGFKGTITYTNCDCTDGAYGDRVYIKKLPNGPIKSAGVYGCSQGSGAYNTKATDGLVFEEGDYQLWVGFNPTYSECETSQIEQVEHGLSEQTVNLTAYGPSGGGD